MQNLISDMQSFGLLVDNVILDGEIHRTPTKTKPSNKNGWYWGWQKFVDDGERTYCEYGNWETNEKIIFNNWDKDTSISKSTKKKLEQHIKETAERIAEERRARQVAAVKLAHHILKNATDAETSPYFERKKVKPIGIKRCKDDYGKFVAIPMFDLLWPDGSLGAVQNVQKIYDNGAKYFLKGGKIKGCFNIIGDVSTSILDDEHNDAHYTDVTDYKTLYFAEGYATGLSIHEATGCPVVVCFNAGNIKPVVEAFQRDEFKPRRFVICADNDQWKPDKGNPGVEKAKAAARQFGCYIAVPDFSDVDTSDNPTDFNDLHVLDGIDAVAVQLDILDDSFANPVDDKNLYIGMDTLIDTEYPDFKERPCYRIYDDWREVSGEDKKFKPGVWYHGTKKEGDTIVEHDSWICSPLVIEAVTHDKDSNNFGRFLRFMPTRGDWRSWPMPMAMLSGSGEELRGELLRMGVILDTKNKQALAHYLNSQYPKTTYEIATQTGWHKGAFLLPHKTVGSDVYFFQSEHFNVSDIPYRQQGTLDDWRQNIARYCVGNPLLMLAVSSAFAGALLKPVHQQGGGFHIFGDSTCGKSTGLFAACSVWGDEQYKRSWRATGNGLEASASMFNDSLMALDEISECDPKEIGNVIYALGNGVGKQRANRSGGMRATNQWRVMVLSNGEYSLAETMREGGKVPKAGQILRLLNIPVFGKYRSFDELHDKQDGGKLSDHLQTASGQYYGVAGVHYLEKLVGDTRNLDEMLSQYVDDFIGDYSKNELNSQAIRAVKRFAVTAVAGELATEYGVTGWHKGDATVAIKECFKQWLGFFGTGDVETRQALEAVKDFIARYSDSRFSKLGNQFSAVNDRAGYFEDTPNGRVYYFNKPGLQEVFTDSGFDRGIKALKAAGWLQCEHGRNTKQRRVNGKIERFYCVNIIENDDLDSKQAA